jgi:hypothetical protein
MEVGGPFFRGASPPSDGFLWRHLAEVNRARNVLRAPSRRRRRRLPQGLRITAPLLRQFEQHAHTLPRGDHIVELTARQVIPARMRPDILTAAATQPFVGAGRLWVHTPWSAHAGADLSQRANLLSFGANFPPNGGCPPRSKASHPHRRAMTASRAVYRAARCRLVFAGVRAPLRPHYRPRARHDPAPARMLRRLTGRPRRARKGW